MSKKAKDFFYIVYRDLENDGYNDAYELYDKEKSSDLKTIKEQVIKGQYGYPDMYVRHLSVIHKLEYVPIISYTDYELTMTKRIEIFARSVKFLDDFLATN